MTRFALIAASATFALAACNQNAPGNGNATTPSGDRPALGQARVNLAPVAPAQATAVIHERRDGMEKIGKLMKGLSREMKSAAPDAGLVRTNAEALDGLAQKASNWFLAGTGPTVAKTSAKPDIWQKPADFSAKLATFQKASAAFAAAAKGTDAAATQARFGDLGKSCKSCHDSYRSERKG